MMCSVGWCERTAYAKGYCPRHYMQFRRTGNPLTRRNRQEASLLERLQFYGWQVTGTGCWEWCGKRDAAGYGVLNLDQVPHRTHRLAYETWVGSIPDGLLIRHKCDNPPCINPEHLETGTHADNARDKVKRGRAPRKLTEQDVLDIRREYGYGVLTQQMLADVYGVSRSTVGNVMRDDD